MYFVELTNKSLLKLFEKKLQELNYTVRSQMYVYCNDQYLVLEGNKFKWSSSCSGLLEKEHSRLSIEEFLKLENTVTVEFTYDELQRITALVGATSGVLLKKAYDKLLKQCNNIGGRTLSTSLKFDAEKDFKALKP